MSVSEDHAARFVAELTDLYANAGSPSPRQMIKAAKDNGVLLNAKTLSSWLGGIAIPRYGRPIQFLIQHLNLLARQRGHETRTDAWWMDLHALARTVKKPGRPRTQHPGHLPVAVGRRWPRVRDLGPMDVGVHPAAFLPASSSPLRLWFAGDPGPESVPAYVPREHDEQLRRSLLVAARQPSGVVVVTGRSCTGKSRSTWEAVSAELGDWYLVDMRDSDRRDALSATRPDGDHVLWLDNLDRADDMSVVLTSALVALRRTAPGSRCLVVATMWRQPELISPDVTGAGSLRELAKLGGVPVTVPESWTGRELEAAGESAQRDRLMAAALSQTTGSPSQLLAGAKWALGLWRNPSRRETSALLTAAIDLARLDIGLNARTAITADLLEKCAPFYLVRPPEDGNWFDDALKEATTPLENAVWALEPTTAGPGRRYQLFDPLLDYARFERRFEPLPAGVWAVLTEADFGREQLADLAESARRRLLLREAAVLERRSALAPPAPIRPATVPLPPKPTTPKPTLPEPSTVEPPSEAAVFDVTKTSRYRADQLLEADDLHGLQRLAISSGDKYVRMRLAYLYERRGDRQALRELATFSRRSDRFLVELIAQEGDVAELLRMILCGDGFALRAVRDWPVTGLDDGLRNHILTNGLAPDGSIASAE